MPNKPNKALLSWSSGKDAAWTLQRVRESGEYEIAGLVTTVNKRDQRVAVHGVRQSILEQQAVATGLDLHVIDLPWPCSNEQYERRFSAALIRLKQKLGISCVIFGDLFLEDIRQYRENQLRSLGLEAVFPLWGLPTAELAREMLAGGLEAFVTCVDKQQLIEGFSGRKFDHRLLRDLPDEVDPCGENGEFHTLVTGGPMFKHSLELSRGPLKAEPRFVYTDFLPCQPTR